MPIIFCPFSLKNVTCTFRIMNDDSFSVVSELSKSVTKSRDVERVIKVTIELNEKSFTRSSFHFDDKDLDVQVTMNQKRHGLEMSQSVVEQAKPAKKAPIDPRQRKEKPPELVEEVTQSEERVTEEDVLAAREQSIGAVRFSSPNRLEMSKSLRTLDENSRSKVNISTADRTKFGRTSPLSSRNKSPSTSKVSPKMSRRPLSATGRVETSTGPTREETELVLTEGSSEFMPLIFMDRKRSEIGERPRFTTSQEGMGESIHRRRPMIVIPQVNDDLAVFHEDDEQEEETKISQEQISPIKAHNDARMVIGPRHESMNTSEFAAMERRTKEDEKPKSSWLFIELEKQRPKKSNEVELHPNMAAISKIARTLLSPREFREASVGMTKFKYDHFIAVVAGVNLLGVYRIGGDLFRMELIWGNTPETILASQAKKYFTYDPIQGKLVECKEQKMSPNVDAISL